MNEPATFRRSNDGRPELLATPSPLPYPRGPLVDRQRAASVLQRFGLKGLILFNPLSVRHISGYDSSSAINTLPQAPIHAVLLSADPKAPPALVMTAFNYYRGFSLVHDPNQVAIYQYRNGSAPRTDDVSSNAALTATGSRLSQAGETMLYADRREAPLDEIEQRRNAYALKQADAHSVGKSRIESILRAMRDLEMMSGKIGVDFSRTSFDAQAISEGAPEVNITDDGDLACSLIRLVKSPAEIEVIRCAARNNAEAALAACRAVHAGDNYRDLRTTFFAETVRHGSRPVWILIDRTIEDELAATFRQGQAFMIDAVSTFAGYHGDYGRTVFVGEPSRSMIRHTKAIQTAWDVIRESLRPGISFDAIRALGLEAIRKSGFDTNVRITPHSVGLAHTDAHGLNNIILEPGMVLSIDCPVVDDGIGGSAHLEDLTLITANGHETLNDLAYPVIVT